jgi:YD repeat-containing protein
MEAVQGVAFSPDGRTVAGAYHSAQYVQMWDADSGLPTRRLTGHDGPVTGLAFSPDGRRLATASADRAVRVWDVGTGECVARLDGHDSLVKGVAFAPDGRAVASAGHDGTVRTWDFSRAGPRPAADGHRGDVWAVAFSPDGSRLASGGGGELRVWDGGTGELVAAKDGRVYPHPFSVTSLAFSPDGRQLACGSYGSVEGTVLVFDLGTSDWAMAQRGTTTVHDVAFSPDGRRLYSVSDAGRVQEWDVATGQALRSLAGHRFNNVSRVAVSADGRRLASAARQEVCEWDAVDGHLLGSVVLGGQATGLGYAPDGRLVAATAADGATRLWDGRTGEFLEVITGTGDPAAFAAGASRFPVRAMVRGPETVVVGTADGRPIAYFPTAFGLVAAHPSSRRWAGAVSSAIYLIQLEGAR